MRPKYPAQHRNALLAAYRTPRTTAKAAPLMPVTHVPARIK